MSERNDFARHTEHAGLSVEWHSFRGGHEIPRMVLQRLGPFITKAVTQT